MEETEDDNKFMLTTSDNPYNPFTQFDEWYEFDELKGYHTCSYLARVVRTSNELSEAEENDALQSGIDEILSYNLLGNYVKVSKKNFKDMIKINKK